MSTLDNILFGVMMLAALCIPAAPYIAHKMVYGTWRMTFKCVKKNCKLCGTEKSA